MCPRSALTRPHHIRNASTQASLVSREPKINVNAPLATIRMPKGTNFSFAGGSWSHPLATSPSASVRVFPPADVVAQGHLRLGIHRDLQRTGLPSGLFPHRLDIGEDRVGLVGLLQRLALLEPPWPRCYPPRGHAPPS